MAFISFKNIEKSFGSQRVLKSFSLDIERGRFVTLLGPSGCGKSTLLRCLAGLERVESGSIVLDNEDITTKNPRLRNVGMIFQQYSLFPTMTVQDNIAFGLKMAKCDPEVARESIKDALRMVELVGSEKKYPSQLSGGEQQRVALARCIVTSPKVLLLDEPFSAIDAKLRKALQARIKEIHKELAMTSVFVTHDQDEAMTMSDTIHLLNSGSIEQSGTPMKLYSSPKTAFVAGFMGNYNLLPPSYSSKMEGKGSGVIRPELIEMSCTGQGIPGEIVDRVPQGNIMRYMVQTAECSFKVDALFDGRPLFEIGQSVHLAIAPQDIIWY